MEAAYAWSCLWYLRPEVQTRSDVPGNASWTRRQGQPQERRKTMDVFYLLTCQYLPRALPVRPLPGRVSGLTTFARPSKHRSVAGLILPSPLIGQGCCSPFELGSNHRLRASNAYSLRSRRPQQASSRPHARRLQKSPRVSASGRPRFLMPSEVTAIKQNRTGSIGAVSGSSDTQRWRTLAAPTPRQPDDS